MCVNGCMTKPIEHFEWSSLEKLSKNKDHLSLTQMWHQYLTPFIVFFPGSCLVPPVWCRGLRQASYGAWWQVKDDCYMFDTCLLLLCFIIVLPRFVSPDVISLGPCWKCMSWFELVIPWICCNGFHKSNKTNQVKTLIFFMVAHEGITSCLLRIQICSPSSLLIGWGGGPGGGSCVSVGTSLPGSQRKVETFLTVTHSWLSHTL